MGPPNGFACAPDERAHAEHDEFDSKGDILAMKYGVMLVLATLSSHAVAQEKGNVIYQSAGPVDRGIAGGFEKSFGAPIQGAPYSATVANESVQTLADGNRIVQSSTGTTARDSQGRTRQDTVLPAIGNLSAANAPHFVFIQDPVAQTSYTLNLADKTAQKMPTLPRGLRGLSVSGGSNTAVMTAVSGTATSITSMSMADPGPAAVQSPLPPLPPQMIGLQKVLVADVGQANTEDLGSQTMEGIIVNGVRTTHTIPAGQMGNEKPISIVTEVWTSPDLKTVVYSKRSDPRMGEQTFQLTNIVRAEPDPALFAVPADFKVIDGPQPVVYHMQQ
jgi:hypothetical protein